VPPGWFSLYVILDVFSRFVVGWLLARRESAFLATRLIEQAIQMHGVDPARLTVHADRGSAMTARSIAQLLAGLGVERSHSRPRVSNDNPFSEAQFKTLKYCPQFPGRFACYEAARAWCDSFLGWYNHEHRHEAIGLFTPADVHAGRHLQLTLARQRVLDHAYLAHPQRFVRGRPRPPVVPQEVWINRPLLEPLRKDLTRCLILIDTFRPGAHGNSWRYWAQKWAVSGGRVRSIVSSIW
jgi:putative transposase